MDERDRTSAKGLHRLDGELKAGPIEPEASRGAVGVEHGVSGDNNVAANIYDDVPVPVTKLLLSFNVIRQRNGDTPLS